MGIAGIPPRVVSRFSCGAASAVATKLTLKTYGLDRVVVAYCATNSEHPDNERFLSDCAAWFEKPIITLTSDEYRDTWDVWQRRRYIAGINGAPCTGALKIAPRHGFQRPDDIHVFGYTADTQDAVRAARLREHFFELTVATPLIERGLKKAACLAMVRAAGIALPMMYGLGFSNNNCIPCSKATSPSYWALVRKHFPDEFARMAALSRRLGVRLCRLNGARAFIDEIPADHPTTDPIQPDCDFLCHLAMSDVVE